MPISDESKTKAMRRLIRKLTVENLWLYVMKTLLDEGPLRAYDIKKRIVSRFGIRPSTITVYTVIYKMRNEGLIEAIKRDEKETLYRPTEFGVKAFEEAIAFLEKTLTTLKPARKAPE